MNLGEQVEIGKQVIVIGGGAVAADVARVALRLGAERVSMYCLEQRDEMPAWEDDIRALDAEGIEIHNGCGPMEFQAAGGKVYYCVNGMLHAKAMIADQGLAAIGSANMDMRSLLFNYEVMMLMYSEPEIRALEAWIENLPTVPRPADEKASVFRDVAEGLVRMLAPLL